MTRSHGFRHARRRVTSLIGLPACVALILLAAGCGPLGDDEEEPTATPTRPAAAARGATPVASPAVATPGVGGPPAARTPVVEDDATPLVRPTRDAEAGAVAEDSPEAAGDEAAVPTPPVVEGCEEPEELPEVQGPAELATAAEADEGVNLRAGPGQDCDVLATLQPGTAVEVVSGPVRSGDFDWVKVEVEGTEGWVAAELLEPVEDDEGA